MQIHELGPSTSPALSAYVAVDNGTVTRKSRLTDLKSVMFPNGIVTDVKVDGASVVSSGVANITTGWTLFDDVTYPITASSIPSTTWTTAVSSSTTLANAKEVIIEVGASSTGSLAQLHYVHTSNATKTAGWFFMADSTTTAAMTSAYANYVQCTVDFSTGAVQIRQTVKKTSGSTMSIQGIYYK